MCGSRGGQGARTPPPPPEKSPKYRVFLAILVRIPCNTTNLPSQHSMLGHHRSASKTPLKWRFADGPMMARLYWYLDPLSPHQLKNIVKVGPPLKKNLDPRKNNKHHDTYSSRVMVSIVSYDHNSTPKMFEVFKHMVKGAATLKTYDSEMEALIKMMQFAENPIKIE